MPKFNLTTIEKWEHRVEYSDVEANTLEEALAAVRSGDIACDDHENLGDADEVIGIECAHANDGKGYLTIPAELGVYGPEPTALKLDANLLAALKMAISTYENLADAEDLTAADEAAWEACLAAVAAAEGKTIESEGA